MVKIPKERRKIEVRDGTGKIFETFFEVTDEELFEKLELIEKGLYQQAEDLKRMESSIYESEVSKFLEFKEGELLFGNNIYQDLRATLILLKRSTEAFMKAEEPINELGIYVDKVKEYFENLSGYADCLASVIEEDLAYFFSDKNHFRVVPSDNINLAKTIMAYEVDKKDVEGKLDTSRKKSTMYI